MSLEQIHRDHYGRLLASLLRTVRDFALAEDALQEAYAIALEHWPKHGEPPNPVAWLLTTARHKAIDRLRRHTLAGRKHQHMVAFTPDQESQPDPQDLLRLIFTCCHPALSREAQVALTLHTVGGLKTCEIARAFLVPEPTMARRLLRAKDKIRQAGIPYRVPEGEELAERLAGVLKVIYLVFNEGYAATSGTELVRRELCAEAIRLGRQVVELLPTATEAAGLLALMLFHHARRRTRVDGEGALVLLEDQDRRQWDRAQIGEGAVALEWALREAAGAPGPFTLEAAIAALHAQAESFAQTDWAQIVQLYDLLLARQPSPLVKLNRAVAMAMSAGWEVGLALLDEIELPGYYLLPATRAYLLRRLGRSEDAATAYREALALVQTTPERRFLERRLEMLVGGSG